jgi:hypothetical protein
MTIKKPNQRVARIPWMQELCKKVPFARMMAHMQKDEPEMYDCWPKTWILPDEKIPDNEYEAPLIFKPSDTSQGGGIHIILHPQDMEFTMLNRQKRLQQREKDHTKDVAIVQRYLGEPMTLSGKKFDLRVYVLVLSLQPMQIFVCTEGLVRVCSDKYEPPDKRNVGQLGQHLTNYSLNKDMLNFVHNDDPFNGTSGGKRTLSSVLPLLGMPHLWEECKTLCANVSVSMCEVLRGDEKVEGVEIPELDQAEKQDCFNILGFDIMLAGPNQFEPSSDSDSDNGERKGLPSDSYEDVPKPYLLEVNASPSLSIDSFAPLLGSHAPEARSNSTVSTHFIERARARERAITSRSRSISNKGQGADVGGYFPKLAAAVAANQPRRSSLADDEGEGEGGGEGAGGGEEPEQEEVAAELENVFDPLPPWHKFLDGAKEIVRGKAAKPCRCTCDHRVHLHKPCAVDLWAKSACIGGALRILQRDIISRRNKEKAQPAGAGHGAHYSHIGGLSSLELIEGLEYQVLYSENG